MDWVRDAAFQNSNNRGGFSLSALSQREGIHFIYLLLRGGEKNACQDLKVFVWQLGLVSDQTTWNVSYMSWAELTRSKNNHIWQHNLKLVWDSYLSNWDQAPSWIYISSLPTYFAAFSEENKMIGETLLAFFLVLHLDANNTCRAPTAQQHLWWKIIMSHYIRPPCIIQRQNFSSALVIWLNNLGLHCLNCTPARGSALCPWNALCCGAQRASCSPVYLQAG